jgi:hypothetical protein
VRSSTSTGDYTGRGGDIGRRIPDRHFHAVCHEQRPEGKHLISVSKPGYITEEREVVLIDISGDAKFPPSRFFRAGRCGGPGRVRPHTFRPRTFVMRLQHNIPAG